MPRVYKASTFPASAQSFKKSCAESHHFSALTAKVVEEALESTIEWRLSSLNLLHLHRKTLSHISRRRQQTTVNNKIRSLTSSAHERNRKDAGRRLRVWRGWKERGHPVRRRTGHTQTSPQSSASCGKKPPSYVLLSSASPINKTDHCFSSLYSVVEFLFFLWLFWGWGLRVVYRRRRSMCRRAWATSGGREEEGHGGGRRASQNSATAPELSFLGHTKLTQIPPFVLPSLTYYIHAAESSESEGKPWVRERESRPDPM